MDKAQLPAGEILQRWTTTTSGTLKLEAVGCLSVGAGGLPRERCAG